MTRERRELLRRKYLSLGLGELGAAAVFCGAAVFTITPRLADQASVQAFWSALLPLLIVLIQAGAYWLLARGWVDQAPMPRSIAKVYRSFRSLNIVFLVVGLVGVLVWIPASWGVTVAVMAVWLFGLIEYMNYFVVRLSYPVSRWPFLVLQWRKPRLVQELESSSR